MARRTDEAVFLVRQIPAGQVISYKALGLAMVPRISPRAVGSVMRTFPEGESWWRVIAADGTLPTVKELNTKAARQTEALVRDGIPVVNGVVAPEYFCDAELLEPWPRQD